MKRVFTKVQSEWWSTTKKKEMGPALMYITKKQKASICF